MATKHEFRHSDGPGQAACQDRPTNAAAFLGVIMPRDPLRRVLLGLTTSLRELIPRLEFLGSGRRGE